MTSPHEKPAIGSSPSTVVIGPYHRLKSMKMSCTESQLSREEKVKEKETSVRDGDVLSSVEKPDLTIRSVLLGTMIGVLMASQNIYFGLRNGMSFGEGMVGAIVGFGLAKTLLRRFFHGFHLHEHVILQTAASANISIIFSGGFTQYILAMTPQVQKANHLGKPEETWTPTYGMSLLWLATAAYLGFFISQPYRKKLIVRQRLPWPHPTATAKVLHTLHEEGEQCRTLTRKLKRTITIAFLWHWIKWVFNAKGQMDRWPILGATAARYTWYTDWSSAYIAGGMLTTPNAVLSMLAGGLYGYGFILPYVSSKRGDWFPQDAEGMVGPKAYWFLSSLSMVVVDGLYQAISMIVKTIRSEMRSRIGEKKSPPFSLSLSSVFSSASTTSSPPPPVPAPVPTHTPAHTPANSLTNVYEEEEPSSRLIPRVFWLNAFILNMILVVIVVPLFFPVKWYAVLSVILVAIPLGYSICLGGAMTGTFIISAVGKLVIIVTGSMVGNVLGSLWLAGIGMITVGSTEQMLVDYQVAHLTKTSPRQMFKAQIFAATIGFLVTPLCYKLFIQAFEITANGTYTAPGGVALRSLAVIFTEGFAILPSNIEYFILTSIIVAVLNCLLKDLLPSKYAEYLPNTMAFAIGFYVNGSYPINNLIGGIIRYVWKKNDPKSQARFCDVIAAGMIVGEGLAAINQAVLAVLGIKPPMDMAIQFGQP